MSGKGPGPSLPGWWGKVRDVIAASVPVLFAAVVGWAYQVNHNLDVLNGLLNQQNERIEGQIAVEDSHLHSLDQRDDRDEAELKELRLTGGDSVQPRLNAIDGQLQDIRRNGSDNLRLVEERLRHSIDDLANTSHDFDRRLGMMEMRQSGLIKPPQ